jgi:hypothetical protein
MGLRDAVYIEIGYSLNFSNVLDTVPRVRWDPGALRTGWYCRRF